ncbi:MAG: Ig-like domain-containing protein, partial [Prevotellaceae bacterium]|nr:Ig-like domain-containing protein [Prevotellaceae bacterium]
MKKNFKMKVNMLIIAALTAVAVSCNEEESEPVAVTGITVSPATHTLVVGEKLTLTSELSPAGATDTVVTWSSSAAGVASVDPLTGEVTALTAGTATITAASANNITGNCVVTVRTPDVYVAGYALGERVGEHVIKNTALRLWKNGVIQPMFDDTKNAWANSVFVSDNDVYVAGYEMNANDTMVATLWKNGVAQPLTDGTNHAEAYSVYVSGNDVYVVGDIAFVATLWINGVAQTLVDGFAALSVYVSSNDVYVAGEERSAEHGFHEKAKLWKNGAVVFSGDTYSTSAFSVFVSDDDVYVAGHDRAVATLWKNGVAQHLSDHKQSVARSVYVSGNDIYVAGEEYVNNVDVATLWKNGEVQYLSDGTKYATANSVYVLGNDVYVAGEEIVGGLATAKLWKNGIEQPLAVT